MLLDEMFLVKWAGEIIIHKNIVIFVHKTITQPMNAGSMVEGPGCQTIQCVRILLDI